MKSLIYKITFAIGMLFTITGCCYKTLEVQSGLIINITSKIPKNSDSINIIVYQNPFELKYKDSLNLKFKNAKYALNGKTQIELAHYESVKINCNINQIEYYIKPVYEARANPKCSQSRNYLFGYYINGQLTRGKTVTLILE